MDLTKFLFGVPGENNLVQGCRVLLSILIVFAVTLSVSEAICSKELGSQECQDEAAYKLATGPSATGDLNSATGENATYNTLDYGAPGVNGTTNIADILVDILRNGTDLNDTESMTSTRKPTTTTTKQDIVDPYDDRGRARREMIFSLALPTLFGVVVVGCIIFVVVSVCKRRSRQRQQQPQEGEAEQAEAEDEDPSTAREVLISGMDSE